MSFLSPGNLARFSARHPWVTLAAWGIIVVVAVMSSSKLVVTDEMKIYGSDGYKGEELLEDRMGRVDPVTENVIVRSDTLTVDDPAFQERVGQILAELRGLEGTVASATSYFEVNDPRLVSADRKTTILPVTLTGEDVDAAETVVPVLEVLEAHAGNGFDVLTAGDGSISKELNEKFEKEMASAETIGIPAAILVLIVVFGAAVAAGIPVILAILAMMVSFGITAVISQATAMNNIVVNIITMIGLAVGIDYTLFILERFREERQHGRAKVDAIVASGETSSRAVLFSGITVIIAMAGLFIVPGNVFQGMAIGAIAAVFSAVLAALTLLPAALSIMGDRVNWLRLPGRKFRAKTPEQEQAEATKGFFGKTTQIVMKHPVIAVVASSTLLVALAVPYATVKIGSPGLAQMPQDLESVRAFTILDREFSAGRLDPAEIVIDGDVNSPEVRAAVDQLNLAVSQDSDFAQFGTLETTERGDLGVVEVIINGDSTSARAMDAVRRLRSDYIPQAFAGVDAEVYVSGGTAQTVDYIDTMTRYLPFVIAFVLALSFVLLLMVFRSIVIPVKAIVMNLLSVGAAYGLVVLVFQHGVGADLMGFQQSDEIAAFLPVFMFAMLFGLSMDYHVFLLTRIQERFTQTKDNAGSVAYGLRSTAHIITGAAAIMMVVFGGFAVGDLVELQQTGFGLAVAVFLDATIVRSVLVPASMELLGEKNWYFPSWLEWIPRIHVEGPALHLPHAAPQSQTEYSPWPMSGD